MEVLRWVGNPWRAIAAPEGAASRRHGLHPLPSAGGQQQQRQASKPQQLPSASPCWPKTSEGVSTVASTDDVVAAVCALLTPRIATGGRRHARRLPLVGPHAMTLRDYLVALRQGLGLSAAPEVAVPEALMRLGASVGEHLPGALLNRAAWTMLQRGSIASAQPLTALLERRPRALREFIEPDHAAGLLLRLQLAWLLPVLRLSLAAVWLTTGVVSMGLFPITDSQALLGRAGVPAALQPLALYGAAALDLAFGVATLWPQRRMGWRRWLWAGQAALVLVYTAVISVRLPEFWLHPYGPMTKNLPLLAVLLVLWFLDRPGHDEPPPHKATTH